MAVGCNIEECSADGALLSTPPPFNVKSFSPSGGGGKGCLYPERPGRKDRKMGVSLEGVLLGVCSPPSLPLRLNTSHHRNRLAGAARWSLGPRHIPAAQIHADACVNLNDFLLH